MERFCAKWSTTCNEIEFDDADDRHTFGDIYEEFERCNRQEMPESSTHHVHWLILLLMMLDPKVGETFGDFTSGTGGFLTSALKYGQE